MGRNTLRNSGYLSEKKYITYLSQGSVDNDFRYIISTLISEFTFSTFSI